MTTATRSRRLATPADQPFLRAILADPESDAPRLIYADHLQETAGERACGCDDGSMATGGTTPWGAPISEKCYACNGTGRVSDGRAERAEFIRVQCGYGDAHWIDNDVADRESELLAAHKGNWLGYWLSCKAFRQLPSQEPIWRRGFVESITVTMAEWMVGPCRACEETGYRYGDSHHLLRSCRKCDGTGHVNGIAASVLAENPGILRVIPSDKRPWEATSFDWQWAWITDSTAPGRANNHHRIPENLFWMVHSIAPIKGITICGFYTEAAAIDAVSAALATWGRKQAIGSTEVV